MGQPADFVLGQPDSPRLRRTPAESRRQRSTSGQRRRLDRCHRGRLAITDTATTACCSGTPRQRERRIRPTSCSASPGATAGPGGAGGVAAEGCSSRRRRAARRRGGRTAVVGRTLRPTASSRGTTSRPSTAPRSTGCMASRTRARRRREHGRPLDGRLSFPATLTVDDENRFWVADFENGRALRFDPRQPDGHRHLWPAQRRHQRALSGELLATRYAWTHFARAPSPSIRSSGLSSRLSFARDVLEHGTARRHLPVSAVQGQVDDATISGSPPRSPATSVSGVGALARVGGRVYWSDAARILSKVGTFSANNAVPDVVLGNQDFTGNVVPPPPSTTRCADLPGDGRGAPPRRGRRAHRGMEHGADDLARSRRLRRGAAHGHGEHAGQRRRVRAVARRAGATR